MDDGAQDGRDERRDRPARVVGKVIKSELPDVDRPVLRPPRPGVLNAEEFEARTAAKQIIEEARKAAAELVEEAKVQREEIFAQARAEARAEVMAQASGELAKAKMQAGQIVAAAEGELVALACRIAEKIIGRDLERDPELLVDICANAIENVRNARAMVVRVSPRDGALLREKRPKLMELIGRSVDIAIKDDPEVEPGGCVVQTEFGTIDAQLKTQFEVLRNLLAPEGKKDGLP